MKIIIDIPEGVAKRLKAGKGNAYDRYTSSGAVIDGTPLEEELKSIKEEIQDLDLGFVDEEYQAGIAYGIMKFNQILNKHIENLKGDAE